MNSVRIVSAAAAGCLIGGVVGAGTWPSSWLALLLSMIVVAASFALAMAVRVLLEERRHRRLTIGPCRECSRINQVSRPGW